MRLALYNRQRLAGRRRQVKEDFSNVVRRTVFFVLTTLLCTVVFAQAGKNGTPPPPVPEKVEAPKTLPGNAGADNSGAPIDPRSYLIGPEDILYVRVWREPDFTGPTSVRPDGKITI